MSESFIRELAEQIVRQQILLNWKLWLIAIALIVVATATSALLVSYFTRKGQHIADRAGLQGLLDQLRATTDAAERVRVEILHADWTLKEWKTIRRVKLEELFNVLYDSCIWLYEMKDIKVFSQDKLEKADPLRKLELISRLYFPELLSDIIAFAYTASEIKVLIAETEIAINQAIADGKPKIEVISAFSDVWGDLYKQAMQQVEVLEKRAPDIIEAIVNV